VHETEKRVWKSCPYGRHCPPSEDHTSGNIRKLLESRSRVELLVLDFHPIFRCRRQDDASIWKSVIVEFRVFERTHHRWGSPVRREMPQRYAEEALLLFLSLKDNVAWQHHEKNEAYGHPNNWRSFWQSLKRSGQSLAQDRRYLAVLQIGSNIQKIDALDILSDSSNKFSCRHNFCRTRIRSPSIGVSPLPFDGELLYRVKGGL
jgi:hypothetical protein